MQATVADQSLIMTVTTLLFKFHQNRHNFTGQGRGSKKRQTGTELWYRSCVFFFCNGRQIVFVFYWKQSFYHGVY